jgi:prepilin-type N-terminal cleavage/methylation domain-containing protein
MDSRRRETNRGFTLIGLLIVVAVIGLASVATTTVSSLAQRRLREEQLLYVGEQYRRAIQLYYEATPPGHGRYPRELGDLLKDPRFVQTRRHLRELYVDPMTARNDWKVVMAPEGGIMGVRSISQQRPVKLAHFSPPFQAFAHRRTYSEWPFYFAGSGPLPEELRIWSTPEAAPSDLE